MSIEPIGNRLLASLPRDDLDMLLPHLTRVELPRSGVIRREGEGFEHVAFPERPAVVALFRILPEGRHIAVAAIDGLGALSLTEAMADTASMSEAQVVMGGTALRIPRQALHDVLPRTAVLRTLVARQIEALTSQVMQNAACNAIHTVEQRLARWLLAAHDVVRGGEAVEPDEERAVALSQELLSEAVGAQRTTVTALAGNLRDAGAIRYSKARIFVVDRPMLESKACRCNRAVRETYREALKLRRRDR